MPEFPDGSGHVVGVRNSRDDGYTCCPVLNDCSCVLSIDTTDGHNRNARPAAYGLQSLEAYRRGRIGLARGSEDRAEAYVMRAGRLSGEYFGEVRGRGPHKKTVREAEAEGLAQRQVLLPDVRAGCAGTQRDFREIIDHAGGASTAADRSSLTGERLHFVGWTVLVPELKDAGASLDGGTGHVEMINAPFGLPPR